ncbi:dixin-like isoform X2 [Xenia sp. Carnegie-2017]|uniref:dixin-like isoform X2 n=1 Tax=Xenia sp. Carnegie-2017 TaxID=2897299 RepID=UPI001F032FE1|nr:dixin-like isoform X2 [Xenia sp. Carnegie-2017]
MSRLNVPGNSPRNKQRKSEDSQAKKVQQMQAYVAWTNSQLRKLPGSKIVEDLARDMQDGIALAQLIEVVAGEKIEIDFHPTSPSVMKENIESILTFISTKKIRLHHVTAKDIVCGNMKAIMRLILALAAHFKPRSVRNSVTSVPEPAKTGRRLRRSESSLSAAAAEAAATLHDVSRAAASVGTPYHGSRLRHQNSSNSASSIDSTDRVMPSKTTKLLYTPVKENHLKRTRVDMLSNEGLREETFSTEEKSDYNDKNIDSGEGTKVSKKRIAIGCRQWKEIVEGYGSMDEEIKETQKKLLELQNLLLNEKIDDDTSGYDGEYSSLDGALLQEQITILNARLDQRSSEYDKLKIELNRTREECINLQGIKQGLQTRLTDQEKLMMKLKAELLKLEFSHQTANSDKDELQNMLDERDKEITLLRSQLKSKDDEIAIQKKELDDAKCKIANIDSVEKDLRSKIKNHEANASALSSQVKELQVKLRAVDGSEIKLSNRITYQDRKISLLEGKVLQDKAKSKREEMNRLRHCIQRLRESVSEQDPQQSIINNLEETLANVVGSGLTSSRKNVFKASPLNNNHHNGIKNSREKDLSKIPDVTRVTYQPSWSSTPSVLIIVKRLGEVTLGDLKSKLGLSGDNRQYRYFFKALDAEFGTIREELVNDDDVVPGWDGKIMAWITNEEEQLNENDRLDSSSKTRAKTPSETDL